MRLFCLTQIVTHASNAQQKDLRHHPIGSALIAAQNYQTYLTKKFFCLIISLVAIAEVAFHSEVSRVTVAYAGA